MSRNERQVREGDWKGWGEYMEAKQRKLGEQFNEQNLKKQSNLFDGVAIFVNGFTGSVIQFFSHLLNYTKDPPADQLRLLMYQHGGQYHMYKTAATTHTIVSQLAASKLKQIKSDDKYIRPEWITQSIAASELLDERPYRLNSATAMGGQTMTQFVKRSNLDLAGPGTDGGPSSVKMAHMPENPPGTSINRNTSKRNLLDDTIVEAVAQPSSSTSTTTQPLSLASLSYLPDHPSIRTTNYQKSPTERQPTKNSNDPSFLSDFYGKSRLHHISMWAQQMKQFVAEIRLHSNGLFEHRHRIQPESDFNALTAPVYMHIDMDCFFVSVVLTSYPDHKGKPVVITHSKGVGPSAASTSSNTGSFSSFSEIASCSYEARAFGLKNGMLLGKAKKLCPDLIPLPYDFEGYNRVSRALYEIVCGYTLEVQAVSCDEMYVCITSVCNDCQASPLNVVRTIRSHINHVTECPVSAGLGPNLLIARLATRRAKPDGQCFIEQSQVGEFIAQQQISDLPGIGYSTLQKMKAAFGDKLSRCEQLQRIQLSTLQQTFGAKTGQSLFDACRGVDNRTIDVGTVHTQKSVSCDVNYGIRFKQDEDAYTFIGQLAAETSRKIRAINMQAKAITLRLLIRAPDQPLEPVKYMGHGICDAISKSTNLMVATDDATSISINVNKLYKQLKPNVTDIRGVSISLSKLISMDDRAQRQRATGMRSIDSFFGSKPTDTTVHTSPKKSTDKNVKTTFENDNKTFVDEAAEDDDLVVLELDYEIMSELPLGALATDINEDDLYSSRDAFTTDETSQSSASNLNILQKNQVDMDVFHQLPADICAELIDFYGGGSASNPPTTSAPKLQVPATNVPSRLTVGRGKPKSSSASSLPSRSGKSASRGGSRQTSPVKRATRSSKRTAVVNKKGVTKIRAPTTFGEVSEELSLTQCWNQPSTSATDQPRSVDVTSDPLTSVTTDTPVDETEMTEDDEPSLDEHLLAETLLALIDDDRELTDTELTSLADYLVSLVEAGGQLAHLNKLLARIKIHIRPDQIGWRSWYSDVLFRIYAQVKLTYGKQTVLIL